MATSKQQIPVGYAKAAAIGQNGPCSWANVFYFLIGTLNGATPGDVLAMVADAVHDFYNDVWSGNWSSTCSLQETRLAYRDAEDSLVRITVADVVVGTNESDYDLGQTAYLVNWSTSDIRKGGKPRSYISGVHDASMADAAHLVGSFKSGVTTLLNTWLTGLPERTDSGIGGLQLEDMSFRNANAWRDVPVGFPIIGVSLNSVIATQRRRVNRLRA